MPATLKEMRWYAFSIATFFSVWCVLTFTAAADAAQVASGSYTGNGIDNRSITGVGFEPDVVFVQADGSPNGVFRTSTMVGDQSAPYGSSSYVSDAIQDLESDGFVLGTSNRVNQNGTTYYWFALEAADGEGTVLRYTGNGSDDRSITGAGFEPDAVIIKGDVGSNAFFRTSDVSGDASYRFTGGSSPNRIQAFASDGFEVGSNDSVNQNTKTYDAIAWTQTSGSFAVGTYTGNGSDDRSITGIGFEPDVVLIKHEGDRNAVFRTDAHSGDTSSVFHESNASNLIQQFESNGFQIGTDNKVNQDTKVFYWMAWKNVDPDPEPTATPTPTPTPESSSGSTGNSDLSGDSSEGTSSTPASSGQTTTQSTPTPTPLASPGPLVALPTQITAVPATQPATGGFAPVVADQEASPTPSATPAPTEHVDVADLASPPSEQGLSVGQVAGIFFSGLIHTSFAADTLPAGAQPYVRTLQGIDTFLIGLATGVLLAFFGIAGYIVHIGSRHTSIRRAIRLALIKPFGSPAAHFDRHAPRAAERGEILIPFSVWRTFAWAEKRCLAAFGGALIGKVLIAIIIVIVFIRVGGG